MRVRGARLAGAAAAAWLLSLLLPVPAAQTEQTHQQVLQHMRAGIQARDEHRLEEAAREFEAAARLAPGAAEIHANLGLVRHRQGNSSAAVEAFQRALQLKPGLPGVQGLLGFHLLMQGGLEAAIVHLEKAERETPSSPDVASWLGLAYFRAGRYQEAVVRWEAVRRARPEDADVQRYLQRAYAALDRAAAPAGASSAGADAAPIPLHLRPREAAIRQACTQCHAWTPPAVLPRLAWLGKIAKMFGLANQGMLSHLGRPIRDLEPAEVTEFFETLAPEELATPPWVSSRGKAEPAFQKTSLPASGNSPGTAGLRLVELFDDRAGPELLICDMFSGWVSWLDPDDAQLQLRHLARLTSPARADVVDLDRDGLLDILVADLGEVLPSDRKSGAVVWLRRSPQGEFEPVTLARPLGRVADARAADFDGDGDLDLIIAEFGWITVGGILYLENRHPESEAGIDSPSQAAALGPESFVARVLDDRAGAIDVPVADLNGDGRPDFLALISQQHETVVAFLNQGGGQFERREIFTAPHPHWGSTGIEPVDLDGDGDLDVLFSNGDSMDDSVRLKPYHGVSWLENRGSFPFAYHRVDSYYGALRAKAGDLDGDGDLDLAAVSWLPELEEAVRRKLRLPGAVWYEQVAPGSFQPRFLDDEPCEHPTLEIGDIDGDGRPDILAGTAWLGTPPPNRPATTLKIWKQLGTHPN